MRTSKRNKLEQAGWAVGSTADFLGLSQEEEAIVGMKLALARNIKRRRREAKLTQQQFAKRLGSSQSRVAKMEAADGSVSMELLVRGLLSLGASRKEVGAIVGTRTVSRKPARASNAQTRKLARS